MRNVDSHFSVGYTSDPGLMKPLGEDDNPPQWRSIVNVILHIIRPDGDTVGVRLNCRELMLQEPRCLLGQEL